MLYKYNSISCCFYTALFIAEHLKMSYFDTQKQYDNWLKTRNLTFDVAICLHTPNQLRVEERGFDEQWLSKKLTRYFNELDRKLFKSAHRKRNVRMKRLVVLGHTDNVGWHAHVCAITPSDISPEKLLLTMNLLWLKHMKVSKFGNNTFTNKLFWGERTNAGYTHYSISNARELPSGATAEPNGSVDILNCHF
jgi:hypothetical protein